MFYGPSLNEFILIFSCALFQDLLKQFWKSKSQDGFETNFVHPSNNYRITTAVLDTYATR